MPQIDSLHRTQLETLDEQGLIDYFLENDEFLCKYYSIPYTCEPPPAKNSILKLMQAGNVHYA
jgi:hypothetical protein